MLAEQLVFLLITQDSLSGSIVKYCLIIFLGKCFFFKNSLCYCCCL